MRISEAIKRGIRLTGTGSSTPTPRRSYFGWHNMGYVFDSLGLAALGIGGPKEAGTLFRSIETGAPDVVAQRITEVLNSSFPQLFLRVARHKGLMAYMRSHAVTPLAPYRELSLFKLITWMNDDFCVSPLHVAKILEEAGL